MAQALEEDDPGEALTAAGRAYRRTALAGPALGLRHVTAVRRLVEEDGLNPDAHQLLGLCLEGLGAPDAAIEQYRLAAYLDHGFALAQLRLGQLARRRGDDRDAARDLDGALGRLAGETEERIVLFGGGFGRIALTVQCRSELDACGAAR